jgi:hypothetical protein
MAAAGQGPSPTGVYTHITNDVLKAFDDTPKPFDKVAAYGKPLGFWYAPDLVWPQLLSDKDAWYVRQGTLVSCEPPPPPPKPSSKKKKPVVPFEELPWVKALPEAERARIFAAQAASDAAIPIEAARKEKRKGKIIEFYEWVFGKKTGEPPMWESGVTNNLPTVFDRPHVVYQFSMEGKFEDDFDKPDLKKVFNLTSATLDGFLAKVREEMKDTQYARVEGLSSNSVIGRYYVERMSKVWGGINFDKSLFPEVLVPGTWQCYMERPSGCLWHPAAVFGSDTPPPPTAILAWARSRSEADQIVSGWGSAGKLSVAGVDEAGTLVFYNISKVGGGRRGRTFRRKAKRSNKNGRRFTRKSKHDVRRDRYA